MHRHLNQLKSTRHGEIEAFASLLIGTMVGNAVIAVQPHMHHALKIKDAFYLNASFYGYLFLLSLWISYQLTPKPTTQGKDHPVLDAPVLRRDVNICAAMILIGGIGGNIAIRYTQMHDMLKIKMFLILNMVLAAVLLLASVKLFSQLERVSIEVGNSKGVGKHVSSLNEGVSDGVSGARSALLEAHRGSENHRASQ